MSQLAITRRYRPRNFEEVVGQETTVRAFKSALETGRLHHAYLLTGTHGVGKTTLARILAKCFNCEAGVSSTPCERCSSCLAIQNGALVDLLEVDAASRTKVEDTRELLDNVQYLPTQSRYKIYIIDEVHMLSGHSFNALLKTLEEPPRHVIFILATTDPQKLPVTVLSRCLQFHLQRLSLSLIEEQLKHVLTQEKISFEDSALPLLARAAEGSMRDALSLLEQTIAYGQGQIRTQECRTLLGLTEQGKLMALFSAIVENSALNALQIIKEMANTTVDFSSVLTEVLTLIHHIAIAQQAQDALDENINDRPEILRLSKNISLEAVQLYYQIALMGQRDLPLAPNSQMGFEMVVLRMLAFRPVNCVSTDASTKEAVWSEVLVTEKEKEQEKTLVKVKTEEIKKTEVHQEMGSEPKRKESKAEPHSLSWPALMDKLTLTGVTKALASHCSMVERLPNSIHLNLEKSQQALLNQRSFERLQTALSDYFGTSIKLKISQEKGNEQTPAHLSQKKQEKDLNDAQQAMATDSTLQALIHRFDAKVETISTQT
jgi:DNA polymerase-3 subunit gamma/tau